MKTNQILFCNVPKLIAVLICKQSLRWSKQGTLPPENKKRYNLEIIMQEKVNFTHLVIYIRRY